MTRTVSAKALRRELRATPEGERLTPGEVAELELARPKLRSQCASGPRPCPFVSCRHHLALEVTASGGIQFAFPGAELEDMPATCSLDFADRGGMTLETIAALFQVTRERVRQIEARALRKLRRRADRGELERFEATPDQPEDFEP